MRAAEPTLHGSAGAGAARRPPRFAHVVVVVFENHTANEVIGAPAAPYLTSLAEHGANFTQSYGVTHPSQPNYLALFSGSQQGITDDSCPHRFAANNLGRQMIAHGRRFVGYAESLPKVGSKECTTPVYARKHVPWADFIDLRPRVSRPFSDWPRRFAFLPRLAFVTPNLCSDMHNCSVATGDAWMRRNLSRYARWTHAHNSLLIVTFDEDDHSGPNRIPTFFYGAHVRRGSYAEHITHYSVLRTIEDMYGLGHLGNARHARTIRNVWR
ncbi:MAG: alkaline phosphatase family protein [Nocardioidaceae bacterium]